MKAENITVFTTNDGEKFSTEAEALAHEAVIKADATIDQYLANVENSRTRTRLKNVIKQWEGYRARVGA